MSPAAVLVLACLMFAAAALYASVGHAGASGYLAAMALFGLAPAVMKPTALTLNVVVAVVATAKFYRAGCFSWRLFWPFALTSVPLAFLGGSLVLTDASYRRILGAVLAYAALRLFRDPPAPAARAAGTVSVLPALLLGALIGLLSGMVGVGGGIFLSPLLLLLGWAGPRQVSGVAAPFILVNSLAGLLGHLSGLDSLPGALSVWGAAVLLGGWLGADYGSRRLGGRTIRRLLAAVLLVAALKMLLI